MFTYLYMTSIITLHEYKHQQREQALIIVYKFTYTNSSIAGKLVNAATQAYSDK